MRISIFGLGYVGCVSAARLAEAGHQVIGVDVNPEKVAMVNAGVSPIVEPGLEALLAYTVSSGRLRATTSSAEGIANSDLAMICVGTPGYANGQLNIDILRALCVEIGRDLHQKDQPFTVVVRSTVLPGTLEDVVLPALRANVQRRHRSHIKVAVNPEFIREGSALKDFLHPPFTLVGADDEATATKLREVYANVEAPFVHTNIKTAEMIKYASNTYHALKVCFANEMGDAAQAFGVDPQEVMRIFRMDTKLNVSEAYLKPGFAFGGSCLPKDIRALTYAARNADVEMPLIGRILESNKAQIRRAVDAILASRKHRIGILGLSFKPGTDDLRESPMVTLVETLIGKGLDVKILDHNVSVARLTGANRRYIEEEIPHVSSLMCTEAADLLNHAELLVVGNAGEETDAVFAAADAGLEVLDLTRGIARQPRKTTEQVDASCQPTSSSERFTSAFSPSRSCISPAWHAQAATAPAEQHTPAPPREYVDTRYAGPAGHIVQVASGADLQAALDKAQPGDTLVLQAGAIYTGPFTLRAKTSGSGWITLISSDYAKGLPSQGTRVTPADAAHMPKLQASYESVVRTAPSAGHYRLVGLEIRPGPPRSSSVNKALDWVRGDSAKAGAATPSAFLENLMVFGSSANDTLDSLPDHIIIDRCYLHGDPVIGARRGIAMNARNGAVVDSYISDIKKVGEDAQAISGWNGPGPYKIVDDYLEAAGENVMFGGQDPSIKDLVPSDIEVRGNHFTKSLAWKSGDPSYQGTAWQVKNIFELKNAQRVLVEGNLLENNWAQAQNGYSILFTVRDQDGSAPWSVVQDVTFKDNVVRHVANGINVLGQDDDYTSQQAKRILIANNLFEDVGGNWGSGNLLQMDNGSQDVTFTHNTALQTGTLVYGDGKPDLGFTYTDNIALQNKYGMIGTDHAPGISSINAFFPGADLRRNAIVGASSSMYPSDNFFPHDVAAVGFAALDSHDYRLTRSSAYKAEADDGGDIGVDVDELCRALEQNGQHLASAVPSCASNTVAMH